MKVLPLLFLCSPLLADGPLFKHKDVYVDREFQNAYADSRIALKGPRIITSASAPTTPPGKIGDIFINTTSGKVYIATATATSASWAQVN